MNKVLNWNENDVGKWMDDNKLGQYKSIFIGI